jgi:hypothetical protein
MIGSFAKEYAIPPRLCQMKGDRRTGGGETGAARYCIGWGAEGYAPGISVSFGLNRSGNKIGDGAPKCFLQNFCYNASHKKILLRTEEGCRKIYK